MSFRRRSPTPRRPPFAAQSKRSPSFRPAIVRWSRSQPPGDGPLPWAADATPVPAATLAPGWPGPDGGTHANAFASTTPPTARLEGLTHTIARVNAIEGILAQMAQTQATTTTSIVQLTSSVAALVRHAVIREALPLSDPAAGPIRTYAAIAGAPVPATGAVAAADGDRAMEEAAGDATAATAAPRHEQLTLANAGGSVQTGAPPSAESDMDDNSMPMPTDALVSMRTRASLAIATMFSGAAGTTAHGTAAEPPDPAGLKVRTHVRFADEFDGKYDAETDGDESAQAERVFFDDEDDDDDPGDGDDDMQKQVGKSTDDYKQNQPRNGIFLSTQDAGRFQYFLVDLGANMANFRKH